MNFELEKVKTEDVIINRKRASKYGALVAALDSLGKNESFKLSIPAGTDANKFKNSVYQALSKIARVQTLDEKTLFLTRR